MNRIIFFFTGCMCFLLHARAQLPTRDETQIKNAVRGMFNGLSKRDPAKIRLFTTHDFLLLENGLIWNNDSLAAKMNLLKAKFSSFQRINTIDFIRVTINGKMAWAAFNNVADFTMDEKKRHAKWLESAVLIKVGAAWKIQLFHSTALQDQQQ